MMPTRNQRYAARIITQIREVPETEHKKYGSIAHQLPVLIRTAGLAQALAFVEARDDEASARLLDHLSVAIGASSRADLMNRSRTASLSEYMCLTQEALAALLWYKRFAQSVLKVEAGGEGDEP